MKNYVILPAFSVLIFCACKGKTNKDEPTTEPPLSALSIIRGQLNHLDTSLYMVMKIETFDNRADTTYIKREEIRNYATPFTNLPDIAESQYQGSYTEERLIDETQNALTITHTARDEKPEIQKQIIIVNLEDIEKGKVQSIYMDRSLATPDSSVQQRLIWQIGSYFQVANIIQKENQQDWIHTIKVTWQ